MAGDDPWGDDAAEETTAPAVEEVAPAPAPAPEPAPAPAAAAPVEEPAPAVEDARPEAEVPPQEDDTYRRPVQLYRHWVRPKFLQYRYMYDYRTNYYNDVIDYLDKRSKGQNPDVPRAQTWAERVLRTHTNPSSLDYYNIQKKEDHHLIQTIASSIRTHNYHTKAYINRKYASVL